MDLCAQCFNNVATVGGVCAECYRKTLPDAPAPVPDFEVSDSGAPVFKDFESMKKFLAQQEKSQKTNPGAASKKSTTATKKKPKGKAPVVSGVEEAAAAVDDREVYMTLNFYMRELDSWSTVQKDAREEREMRAPSTLVFAHNHQFGAECTDTCKEVLK